MISNGDLIHKVVDVHFKNLFGSFGPHPIRLNEDIGGG